MAAARYYLLESRSWDFVKEAEKRILDCTLGMRTQMQDPPARSLDTVLAKVFDKGYDGVREEGVDEVKNKDEEHAVSIPSTLSLLYFEATELEPRRTRLFSRETISEKVEVQMVVKGAGSELRDLQEYLAKAFTMKQFYPVSQAIATFSTKKGDMDRMRAFENSLSTLMRREYPSLFFHMNATSSYNMVWPSWSICYGVLKGPVDDVLPLFKSFFGDRTGMRLLAEMYGAKLDGKSIRFIESGKTEDQDHKDIVAVE